MQPGSPLIKPSGRPQLPDFFFFSLALSIMNTAETTHNYLISCVQQFLCMWSPLNMVGGKCSRNCKMDVDGLKAFCLVCNNCNSGHNGYFLANIEVVQCFCTTLHFEVFWVNGERLQIQYAIDCQC